MTVTTVYGSVESDDGLTRPRWFPVLWRTETGMPVVCFHEKTRLCGAGVERRVVAALMREITNDPSPKNVEQLLHALIDAMVERENEAHRYDCSDL